MRFNQSVLGTLVLASVPAALLIASTPASAQSSYTPAAASIYHLYVSPSGSDSNSGSQSSPLRSITKAASVAKPSTTIHVAAGTYSNVTTTVSGNATGRIRIISDTKWAAKIVGTGTEYHWSNRGNYVDIVGFDISGTGRLGIVNYGSFNKIEANHVHDLKISGGCNGDGGAGIVNANYSATDNDVIGNRVHDIGTPGACNGVQGIYHSHLRGHIYNNIVYRVSAWGIHLWHAANNVTIANNTVFANGSGGMGGGIEFGVGDSPGGVVLNNTTVANNIVYRNASGIVQYCYSGQSCIGPNNTVANNLVYGNSGAAISLRAGSASATVTAEPQFVNYQANGSGDYHLASSSPAINKGTSANAPAFDIDQAARPGGGAFDIGAYEFGATSTAPSASWVDCAQEGGICNFSGTRDVRYGAGASFAVKSATSSIACTNAVFGDPIQGTVKSCQYSAATTSAPAPVASWTACASEAGTCSVPGTREVRYGTASNYTSRVLSGAVSCSNATFGDPAPGIVKSCAYSSVAQ